jgi:glycogen operon protein
VGDRWREWNAPFRDDVRAFVKGDRATVLKLADRLLGSPDLYAHEHREVEQSINFVACHDGFTLNDVVSYNQKHNEANGEGNRDGHNHNVSWNCGTEGPSSDPAIEQLRNRQVKNLFALTLLSMGVPMLLMGDEVRRTQRGNNNAYCQDNEVSWFDWQLLERHQDIHRFVELLIQCRRDMASPHKGREPLTAALNRVNAQWHGVRLFDPDWSEDSHSLALTVNRSSHLWHAMFNAYWEPLTFSLPEPKGHWRRFIDTSLESPEDILTVDEAPTVATDSYAVAARSVVVLVAPR